MNKAVWLSQTHHSDIDSLQCVELNVLAVPVQVLSRCSAFLPGLLRLTGAINLSGGLPVTRVEPAQWQQEDNVVQMMNGQMNVFSHKTRSVIVLVFGCSGRKRLGLNQLDVSTIIRQFRVLHSTFLTVLSPKGRRSPQAHYTRGYRLYSECASV